MTEPIHSDADDGFHEIQLSGKQLVALFMAGTTVAVMIFLCGVWVGRGVPTDRGAADNPDTTAAAPPPAATPSQPVASSGPPSAEPPAPAAEPDDELSYAKRLQADSAPAEKLKTPQTAATPPPPAPKPAAPQSAAPQSATPAATSGSPPPAATPSSATPSSATPSSATPSSATAAQAKPKPDPAAPQMSARPGAWIVQVVSLQDRSAANAIAKRLSGKGYPAFVLDPAAGGPRIYRVQVGGYTDKNEAEQASRRLEREDQFKPFVRAR